MKEANMEGRCNNCKWYVDGDQEGSHTCKQPKAIVGYRHTLDNLPIDGIWLENDEGWAWYVGAEFGCVNHDRA